MGQTQPALRARPCTATFQAARRSLEGSSTPSRQSLSSMTVAWPRLERPSREHDCGAPCKFVTTLSFFGNQVSAPPKAPATNLPAAPSMPCGPSPAPWPGSRASVRELRQSLPSFCLHFRVPEQQFKPTLVFGGRAGRVRRRRMPSARAVSVSLRRARRSHRFVCQTLGSVRGGGHRGR